MTVAPAYTSDFAGHDFVRIPGFVAPNLLNELNLVGDAVRWASLNLPEGVVRQHKQEAVIEKPFDRPAIVELTAQLRTAIASLGIRSWVPDEYVLNRYDGPSDGITPHRDSARYQRAVAVLTLTGQATFRICATRDGPVLAEWNTIPADLVVLRGADNLGKDRRPFHAIDGPRRGSRTSLSIRQRYRR